jgi:hypothetical protein
VVGLDFIVKTSVRLKIVDCLSKMKFDYCIFKGEEYGTNNK